MSGKRARAERKEPRGPNKCIFCEKPGNMSKQHIWPDWLEGVFPRNNDSYIHEVRGLTRIDNTPEYYNNKKKFQGHQGTSKVRKLCISCNTQWMSRIENDMKEVFSSLMFNEPIKINADDQILLTTWAVMETMVAELAKGAKGAIPEKDRSYFYENRTPPEGWKVWIAKNGGFKWQDQMYMNRKIALPEQLSDFGKFVKPDQYNTQLSIFGIGSLLLITFKIPWVNYEFEFKDKIGEKLIQLLPNKPSEIDWEKCFPMTDSEIDTLFDYFKFEVTFGQRL